MIRPNILLLLLAALLTGCASEGFIVQKTFRPLPFSYSLGLDGVYKFDLRDERDAMHEQMVTREVYVKYEVGDYFSDRHSRLESLVETAQHDADALLAKSTTSDTRSSVRHKKSSRPASDLSK